MANDQSLTDREFRDLALRAGNKFFYLTPGCSHGHPPVWRSDTGYCAWCLRAKSPKWSVPDEVDIARLQSLMIMRNVAFTTGDVPLPGRTSEWMRQARRKVKTKYPRI